MIAGRVPDGDPRGARQHCLYQGLSSARSGGNRRAGAEHPGVRAACGAARERGHPAACPLQLCQPPLRRGQAAAALCSARRHQRDQPRDDGPNGALPKHRPVQGRADAPAEEAPRPLQVSRVQQLRLLPGRGVRGGKAGRGGKRARRVEEVEDASQDRGDLPLHLPTVL